MSYGRQYGSQYGGASPSYAPQQLPGGGGYDHQPYSPTPQPAYQGHLTQQQRAYSPQPPQAPLAAAQPQIQPGAITYTTTAGPDGPIYHSFKAVPASYQTPSGIVSGIQWIPIEATSVLPVGAQPAGTDFAESWNRGRGLTEEDKKNIEKWQREEEKRRRKDEKEAAKVVHGWERDRKDHQKQLEREERELIKARERDRRRSGNYSSQAPIIPGGYPGSDYDQQAYGDSSGLAQQMSEVGLGSTAGGYGHGRKSSAGFAMPRSRRNSVNAGVLENALRGNAGSDYADRSPYGSQVGSYQQAGSGYGTAAGSYANPSSRPLSRGGPGSPYAPNRSPLPADTALLGGPIPGYSAQSYGGSDVGRRPTTAEPYARPVSPYVANAVAGSSVAGSEIYPRGHVLEGRPMPRSPIPGLPSNLYGADAHGPPVGASGMPPIVPYAGSTSRPPSRIGGGHGQPSSYGQPVYGAPQSTYGGGQQQSGYGAPQSSYGGGQPGYGAGVPAAVDPVAQAMVAPEGFTRPPNRAQPYNPFEPVKIQDMDEFVDNMPRMPLALVSHDVTHGDWIRFMTDISLAWSGRLPLPPGSRLPRPSTAVADLVDLWNDQFFTARAVEVVLYKGRERRTGPDAGMVDDLPLDGEASESSSSESEDSESDDDQQGGGYGYDRREARRARRAERKAEKKRRRKEKKLRRKAREQERRYSLYVTYVPGAPPPGPSSSMYRRH